MSSMHPNHEQQVDQAIPFEFMYMAPVGLILAKVTGDIEVMNPFASQLLMPFYQNTTDNNFFKIIHPIAPELEDKVKLFSMRHGMICQSRRIPLPAKKKNAKCLAIGISITKLSFFSGDERLMIMVSDETEAFKQEQLNHDKSEFWAKVSHEIRTPLHSMLGLTELLEHSALDSDSSEIVHRISDAGQILLHNLNDVLDFSKIESGKMRLQLRSFSLYELVSHSCELQQQVATRSGVSLKLIENGAHCCVRGDDIRLSQILLNLTHNAIKFTQGRTEKSVVISVHVLAQNTQTAKIRFAVTDTGIGIAEDKINQLFLPFSQISEEFETPVSGTGLGLSICKSLVDLMGGQIGVESTPGQGSTFWFELCLPLTESLPNDGHGLKNRSSKRLLGKTILVVDDNEMNRFMMQRILQHEGAKVVIASNGKEACNVLSQHAGYLDLVLMDIQMPVMDGLEATRTMRRDVRFKGFPILICSAGVQTEDRQRAENAGASGFIVKPVQLDTLINEIARVTENRPREMIVAGPEGHGGGCGASSGEWCRID